LANVPQLPTSPSGGDWANHGCTKGALEYGSKQYFNDCMDYFNRFLAPRDIAWKGTIDHQGTHDTVTVYHDLYSSEPPVAWVDMTSLYCIKKNSLKVV
jgi:hypothetical protein